MAKFNMVDRRHSGKIGIDEFGIPQRKWTKFEGGVVKKQNTELFKMVTTVTSLNVTWNVITIIWKTYFSILLKSTYCGNDIL